MKFEDVASHPIAVVRRRGVHKHELPRLVPEACGLVWRAVKAAQVTGAGRHIAIYRGGENGLLDVEIGVEVSSPFPGHEDVVGTLTPAGEVATATHFGPYAQLRLANEAIRGWCDEQGRTRAGISWEIYGHWQQEWDRDPSQIRTDVFYLLES
ncbi:MAG: GyrI-like domain-containing protein [Vicinamibacterales bacterium]